MASSYTVTISVLYLACGVFIFLLGLTILRIGRSTAPTRATALMLFFAGVGPLLSASGIIVESTLREGSVVYQSMVDSFEYLWEFYFPSLMLFALVFPRENDVFRRYPVVGLVVFLPYIFHLAIMMFGDRMLDFVAGLYKVFPAERAVSLGQREVDVGGFDNIVNVVVRILERAHRNFFALVNISYSVAALYMLWRNRGLLINPRLVRQVRTVGIGLAVSVGLYSLTKLSMMAQSTVFPADVSLALINSSLVVGGGTIAYAVVRQQFLGIRDIFRRAILYSGVAVVFAFLYLVIVRPISDFFLQYSSVSREAFETGFIIIAIIAFQPALVRTEEILGRLLLKERVDVTRHFRDLSDAVASVTSLDELRSVVSRGLREALDTSEARLEVADDTDAGRSPFVAVLAEIGEPVRRQDLLRLREDRAAGGRSRGWWRRRRQKRSEPTELDHILDPAALRYEVYVPLVKDRRPAGYLGLTGKIYGVPYTTEDLGNLALLAPQVGAALHNIELLRENLERQLFEEELKIARKIQTQLLPGAPPQLECFEVSAQTVPSRYVGGDYYDFVVIDDRWLVLVVADVSGKGIPASILTATLQAAVRSNADAQTDPVQMLYRLNALLFRNTSPEEFATLFYGVVDMEGGTLRYANAGHDFPLVVNGDGVRELGNSGIVLGCLEEFEYGDDVCAIPDGGVVAIYTDGVTDCESPDGEAYGSERLKRVLESNVSGSARSICQAVVHDVQRFGDSRSVDDLTLVVLKRRD
jgi:sigma-B regulation protein RsbU (phosphoserine phosphatase)